MKRNMTRLVGLFLAAVMLLTAVPVLAASSLKGDLNLDGMLSNADLTMMKEYIVGTRNLSGQALMNADMNDDGNITSTDVAKLNSIMNCSHAHRSVITTYSDCIGARDNGNNTHTAVYVTVTAYSCSDCGKIWEEKGNDRRTVTEQHHPTRYGTCDESGAYVPPYYPVSPTAVPSSGGTGNHQMVPDSGTRRMTESECWGWTYEALGFVYHEILARHGFIFDPNGNYGWYFNAQAWYHSISSRNNEDVYSRLNSTEWYNIDLIKSVRQKMKNQGTTNPNGRQAPQHTSYYNSNGGYNELPLPVGGGFY